MLYKLIYPGDKNETECVQSDAPKRQFEDYLLVFNTICFSEGNRLLFPGEMSKVLFHYDLGLPVKGSVDPDQYVEIDLYWLWHFGSGEQRRKEIREQYSSFTENPIIKNWIVKSVINSKNVTG